MRRRSHRENATLKRQKRSDDKSIPAQRLLTSELRSTWNEFFESNFFLKAPSDLYGVFELALELRPKSPCEAFVDTLGLRLIGPFDLLAAANEKEVTVVKPLYLHGRFFFDPPEVAATVLDTDSDVGRHWGYFRDAPDQVPEYIVCAESSGECKFDIAGSNLFDVLESRLQICRSSFKDYEAANLLQKIKEHREGTSLSQTRSVSSLRSKRSKEYVAPSLHQLGIVVPVDIENNTGYRELPTNGKDLADLLHRLKKDDAGKNSAERKRLSELMTRATIACDECDFGTGLLLGLDVFSVGSCVEKEALQLLRIAYMLLDRVNLYKILSGHCKHRDNGNIYACLESIVASSKMKGSEKYSKLEALELPTPLNGDK